MKGLNLALTEGWLIQRARDMCSFAHDRYRQAAQAEVEKLDPHTVAMMSLRIILMMLHESPIDVYRIAEHAKRYVTAHPLDLCVNLDISCLPLLHENPKRDELLDVLIDAGESAWARGAHEACYLRWKSSFPHLAPCQLAYHSFTNARSLLRPSSWENNYQRTLSTWKGDYEASTNIIEECLGRCQSNEDKANVLRLRSRNSFLGSRFADALTDTLQALKLLGVEVNPTPTRREADTMFEKVWYVPGTALGFFWALGAAAERRELYRFSSDMAKLALRIADRHGTSGERCRAQVLYCSMVSGFDSCHIRANVAVMDEAIRLGNSAGDRHLNCIRVLGGYTYSQSIDTVFDTENFKESEYAASISTTSGNVVAFYCVGFVRESAALGFEVYRTRDKHPKWAKTSPLLYVPLKYSQSHRHVRYSLFFHSLAMIACIRGGQLDQDDRATYFKQVELNQQYIRKFVISECIVTILTHQIHRWLSPSPVNTSTWVAIVDAEMAAIRGYADALKLYDIAIAFQSLSLAERNYLNSVVGARSQYPLKRPIFSSEVAVQTESIAAGIINQPLVIYGNPKPDYGDEQEPTLSEADLSSILKWSQDISRDIQLSSGWPYV
ncbi:Ser-Thr histidine kinase [Salix suchowensis]|nr:Ser-Thr histidine kinase [Salix suchowensis]